MSTHLESALISYEHLQGVFSCTKHTFSEASSAETQLTKQPFSSMINTLLAWFLCWRKLSRSMAEQTGKTLHKHKLTLIPTWISNHMPSRVWNEITYPFWNFSCAEDLKWISNFIQTFTKYYLLTHAEMRVNPWASCQIRKIAGAHAPGMPGTFSPSPQVSDPDMHHGTCVTHVPWCMPGSLTSGFLWNRQWGKTFPAFLAHAQPAILRIW